MRKPPLELKPHHAEGAQRFIAWGKNESHEEMLKLLEEPLKDDPEAELVFIQGFDAFCKRGCINEGEDPPCLRQYGSTEFTTQMDEEVAREHGWEFYKPYKIKDILDQLRAEAPDRKIFYVTELTREEYQKWLENIRTSKKHKK